MYNYYEDIVHWLAMSLGHSLTAQVPIWLHSFLHLTLFWAPLAMLVLAITIVVIRLRGVFTYKKPLNLIKEIKEESEFGANAYAFIIQYTLKQQVFLAGLGLLAMPVLYLTLELPKIIINDVISSENFPIIFMNVEFSQSKALFALSAVFLCAISLGGILKYCINVYKGKVGERILRRFRLLIYRCWREGRGPSRRSEIIPLIALEAEPIGGFASDAFSLPVFQGGTFVTILVFMFVQDPVLGAAAITLLPLQLYLIPKLQRRVNVLARHRVKEIRILGGELGDQSSRQDRDRKEIQYIGASLKNVETIRRNIHKVKFLMKALNNFLTALTPFFFYSIGGFLVIENSLTIGALIAVIAAQKEFSSPLKELFKYYQEAANVSIRFQEVIKFLDEKTTNLNKNTV
ncbi:ABC transporter ATP-binding protein [Kiloniella antarctica]|uniref:ABC transporter ATP-binding protein n=1 Tax=Kiloniella antarctica TaxID=1550907 RepID=A0ABW5BQF0_9PROT